MNNNKSNNNQSDNYNAVHHSGNNNKIELSIVVPMYNEAENIKNTVSLIYTTMQAFNAPWELIFVNDGSTDDSLEIAREWELKRKNLRIISYPANHGRGRALREGFKNANGRYIVTIDFDLSYSPDHILKIYNELADPVQMNDVVLGSAYMKGGQTVGVSAFRLFISRLGNKVLEFAFPYRFKTTTCILRGYKREVIEALDLQSDQKEIHLEILSKICALGYNVKEIPATLTSRTKGTSKFRFKRTAFTHILFSLFEKPIILFGIFGFLLTLGGLLIGLYVVWMRYAGILHTDRPLIPLMLLLLITGSQFFSFAFIASQNNYLRNELYRVQKNIKKLNSRFSNLTDTDDI